METTINHGPPLSEGRPRFAPRQQLTAAQLNGIVEDELRRQRLISRAMYGYGVVFGYALKRQNEAGVRPESSPQRGGEQNRDASEAHASPASSQPSIRPETPDQDKCGCSDRDQRKLQLVNNCITIGCGLIIDRYGRELYWPGRKLGTHDVVRPQPTRTGWHVLKAHYAEWRDPPDWCGSCASDHGQWVKQGVVFSLNSVDECPQCEEHPNCPPAECTTICDYVCERTGSVGSSLTDRADLEMLYKEPSSLCNSECGRFRYDATAGVPIACVGIREAVPSECGVQYGFDDVPPKICAVRPFVYRNPLLYELVRGCHLDHARIKKLSDRLTEIIITSWQQPIDWEALKALFADSTAFTISFTHPILPETLHAASVFMSAVGQESAADYWRVRRIPLKAIEPLDIEDNVATGGKLAWSVRLMPDPDWITSEMNQKRGTLMDGGHIELTIRGQLLRDACGRMLDARPILQSPPQNPFYLDPKWSGQARPGDDFVTYLRVGSRR